MFELSDNSKKNRRGIDPKLIEIDDLAITLTLVDYGHTKDAGLRQAARQYELFLNKVSKADGYKKLSKHQAADDGYGKALDFYAYIDGKAVWENEPMAMVACAFFQSASILGYSISWGGLWKPGGWDKPHIQLID